jgi:hypothetical protein
MRASKRSYAVTNIGLHVSIKIAHLGVERGKERGGNSFWGVVIRDEKIQHPTYQRQRQPTADLLHPRSAVSDAKRAYCKSKAEVTKQHAVLLHITSLTFMCTCGSYKQEESIFESFTLKVLPKAINASPARRGFPKILRFE